MNENTHGRDLASVLLPWMHQLSECPNPCDTVTSTLYTKLAAPFQCLYQCSEHVPQCTWLYNGVCWRHSLWCVRCSRLPWCLRLLRHYGFHAICKITFLATSLCSNHFETKIIILIKHRTLLLIPSPFFHGLFCDWLRITIHTCLSRCLFSTLMFCFDGNREWLYYAISLH